MGLWGSSLAKKKSQLYCWRVKKLLSFINFNYKDCEFYDV